MFILGEMAIFRMKSSASNTLVFPEASADKISEEYYCTTINDTKVLKLGILYGANASGNIKLAVA